MSYELFANFVDRFQLIGKQEVYRKLGVGIDGDEEQLRAQLENIQVELNAPTQFKVGNIKGQYI